VYAQFLAKLRGMEVHESALVETQAILKSSLQVLERRLKQTGWVAGTEQPTIADICLACEAEQLAMINHDMSSYPQVQAWQRSMRKLPEFNAVSGWVTWLCAASSTHELVPFALGTRSVGQALCETCAVEVVMRTKIHRCSACTGQERQGSPSAKATSKLLAYQHNNTTDLRHQTTSTRRCSTQEQASTRGTK